MTDQDDARQPAWAAGMEARLLAQLTGCSDSLRAAIEAFGHDVIAKLDELERSLARLNTAGKRPADEP